MNGSVGLNNDLLSARAVLELPPTPRFGPPQIEWEAGVSPALARTLFRSAPPKITSFPRKRESIVLIMGPRFRGDDNSDFHSSGWAAGPGPHRTGSARARERDAPVTAGETPAPRFREQESRFPCMINRTSWTRRME